MGADDARGMLAGEPGGDGGPPVAALDGEFFIAEGGHQLGPEAGHGLGAAARGGRAGGEAEAGERGDDDVEGIGRVAAMGAGVGEKREDALHFKEGAGPAVTDEEGHGPGPLPFRVDEVDGQAVDLQHELGEAIEAGLDGAPVEPVPPMGGQVLQEGAGGAVRPGVVIDLVRPAGAGEAGAEVVEVGLGDGDAEGGGGAQWRRGPRR